MDFRSSIICSKMHLLHTIHERKPILSIIVSQSSSAICNTNFFLFRLDAARRLISSRVLRDLSQGTQDHNLPVTDYLDIVNNESELC